MRSSGSSGVCGVCGRCKPSIGKYGSSVSAVCDLRINDYSRGFARSSIPHGMGYVGEYVGERCKTSTGCSGWSGAFLLTLHLLLDDFLLQCC